MRWIDALKEWNKGSPTWCIARKGTKAYDEVKAIQAGKKIEAAAEPKAEAKPMAQGIDMREVQRKRKQTAKLAELKQSAKDTVASALASIPAAAPKKNMMPSMMASIADIAKKAQMAKEKAWVPKTRDGKVYKRTIGGVVYLSDYLNQLWLKDPSGSVGDWVGVYLPGENRIDTTASDPYEEVVALPVMKEKQNTSKTELEEELDVGFVYKPAGRRMEQSIFEDIVRMAGEMERADPKYIIRKEMEKVLEELGGRYANNWKGAMEGLLKNASFSLEVKGGISSENIENILNTEDGKIPTASELQHYALIRMMREFDYRGSEIDSGYERISMMSITFYQETMNEIASKDDSGLYDSLNMMPDSFYGALSKLYKAELDHTPAKKAQEVEDWLGDEENEEYEDYYGTFLEYEGISTTLRFSQRYEESKERDKLLEEFETIMKQKGAQVGRDWRKKSNESLQEGIDKMKTYKDKEVSNDDEGERKKLVKEVKELLKQKKRKWAGYTTFSIKNLKKGIEDLKARPDKK